MSIQSELENYRDYLNHEFLNSVVPRPALSLSPGHAHGLLRQKGLTLS